MNFIRQRDVRESNLILCLAMLADVSPDEVYRIGGMEPARFTELDAEEKWEVAEQFSIKRLPWLFSYMKSLKRLRPTRCSIPTSGSGLVFTADDRCGLTEDGTLRETYCAAYCDGYVYDPNAGIIDAGVYTALIINSPAHGKIVYVASEIWN